MVNVNQESLIARIEELEARPRSMKEDFALEAYRMLLQHVAEREKKSACVHDWWTWPVGEGREFVCLKCGEKK